jgi:hypothetical protein
MAVAPNPFISSAATDRPTTLDVTVAAATTCGRLNATGSTLLATHGPWKSTWRSSRCRR